MKTTIEMCFVFIILILSILTLCATYSKKQSTPAGYTNKQSIYDMDPPVYPNLVQGVYSKIDNCYQNGGVYNYERNMCMYDYQNTEDIRYGGFVNPGGHITQEYAYQSITPINEYLPY